MKNQKGMVLLLCLIFLTALTLLGLSASAEAILQKQLTANLQETERARQSALSALSWAENWLLNLEETPEICSTGCVALKLHATGTLPVDPESKDLIWWTEQGHEAGIDPVTGERVLTMARNSIDPPMWIIEVAHEVTLAESGATSLQVWYRIITRGSGRTRAGVSVIESTVLRIWPVSEPTELQAPAISGRVAWRKLR